jgi:tRNA1Val (adenine37-N6)-methyltransferase
MTRTTRDVVCRGELTVLQPAEGYRFNVDSLILADFAVARAREAPAAVLDLGAGCGVVGLMLARRWPSCRVLLIELQPGLAALAEQNIRLNGLQSRVESQCIDLRNRGGWEQRWRALGRGRRVIVSNPPYFKVREGRASPNDEVARARHELSCTLEQLLEVCSAALGPGDALALVHAMARRDEVLAGLRRCGLGACTVRGVRPLPGRTCGRVLYHATKDAPAARVELEPLLVQEQPGAYSEEMKLLLGEH